MKANRKFSATRVVPAFLSFSDDHTKFWNFASQLFQFVHCSAIQGKRNLMNKNSFCNYSDWIIFIILCCLLLLANPTHMHVYLIFCTKFQYCCWLLFHCHVPLLLICSHFILCPWRFHLPLIESLTFWKIKRS